MLSVGRNSYSLSNDPKVPSQSHPLVKFAGWNAISTIEIYNKLLAALNRCQLYVNFLTIFLLSTPQPLASRRLAALKRWPQIASVSPHCSNYFFYYLGNIKDGWLSLFFLLFNNYSSTISIARRSGTSLAGRRYDLDFT